MKCLEISHVRELLRRRGLEGFLKDLNGVLREDFAAWQSFKKSPRVAHHVEEGVVELMPISNGSLFAFKYVNGHPGNTKKGKLCVCAYGALSRMDDGYPILLSEMTMLTALRTAATAALAAEYLARPNSSSLGIIGNGAQSECLVLAHCGVLPALKRVLYYDIDSRAMRRFEKNMGKRNLELVAARSAREVAECSDVLLTATAAKAQAKVVEDAWVGEGTHIGGVGGDCPGKTELDAGILERAKVVVEYLPQSSVEGEIQIWDKKQQEAKVYGQLWELVVGKKAGRESEEEVTLFDAVGFALEDLSVLRLCKGLADEYGLGRDLDLVPSLEDPRALFDLMEEV